MIIPKQIIRLDVAAGTKLAEAIKYAVYYSRDNDVIVTFEFNGINMHIKHSGENINKQIDRHYVCFAKALEEQKKSLKILSALKWVLWVFAGLLWAANIYFWFITR